MTPRAIHRLFLLSLIVCTAAVLLPAQKHIDKKESAEAIVSRVEQQYAKIIDYTVDLDVNIDLQGLIIPPVHATMYFKQPDKVKFKSEGFAMLPREAAAFSIGRIRSLNTVEDSVAREVIAGETKLKVSMIPKADKTKLSRVFLYVDPNRWTTDQAVTQLPDGRVATAVFQYQRQDSLWLPSSLVLSFSALNSDTADSPMPKEVSPSWTPRAPRQGQVLLHYSNYRINTGLGDDFFQNPAGQEPEK
jgi:hypothetical protein